MDDLSGKVEIFPEHFQPIKVSNGSYSGTITNSSDNTSLRSRNTWAVSLLNLLALPRFRWPNTTDEDDKVVLTKAEVESLRSEIADAEERETHLRAQLENIDEVLKSARLFGYLYIRTRWSELPGEPPILDDSDVDDWLPRFVVLHGSCLYYFLKSIDLSPQDTTLLSDIVELGPLKKILNKNDERRFGFYVLTSQGLRFECSAMSEIQVESWLRALRNDCKLKMSEKVSE